MTEVEEEEEEGNADRSIIVMDATPNMSESRRQLKEVDEFGNVSTIWLHD